MDKELDKTSETFEVTPIEYLTESHSAVVVEVTHFCILCNELFSNEEDLAEHIKLHDKKEAEVVQNVIEELNAESLTSDEFILEETHFCSLCQKLFPTKEDLQLHERSHEKINSHMCPVCNCRFDPKLHEHPMKRFYVCGICKKGFQSAVSLKTHFFKHIQDSECTCHICHKTLNNKNLLKRHYSLKHQDLKIDREKSFLCTVCGKAFATRGNLSTHARVHSEDRPHVCDICQRGFKSNWELKSHFLIHTNEKPYICKICKKGFRQSGNLASHLRIHNDEKPFVCKVCHKGFVESGKLRRHFRIHTSEKPYICSTCGKAFSDGSNMKAHAKIHGPFICNFCGKAFRDSSKMETHSKIHHMIDNSGEHKEQNFNHKGLNQCKDGTEVEGILEKVFN